MQKATRSERLRRAVRNNYKGWLFTLPVTLGIALFTFIPIVSSLYYSFTENDFFNPVVWVGGANYVKMFTEDLASILLALKNTAIYTVISVPLSIVLSYLLAVFLNIKHKGIKVFRVLYYLPCVIPGIVSGLLWKDILNPNWGLANMLLESLGLPRSEFYNSASSAMPTMISLSFFGLGGGMIMWLAQLKAIPTELYESARVDGAGRVRQFFLITIPLSTPMIFYNLITGLIGSLQIFASVYIMTGSAGGSDDSLLFYVGIIYRNAFEKLNMGYAAAQSWLLFVIIGMLTFIMFRTSKWVQYAEEK